MPSTLVERALQTIANCDCPKKLRQIAENALRLGQIDVVRAAKLRLYEILPSEKPGTFEHTAWKSIYALEDTMTTELGKSWRLQRTRQKIARVGLLQTIKDLILSPKPSRGFTLLIDRQMGDLAFEAVALLHPGLFDETVLSAAAARLQSVGLSSKAVSF